MSRVLKFRAWDKWRKEMISPKDGDFIAWHGPSNWKDCYEVMQFTGLLDSKGVEIYEGDIVRKEYKHHVGMAEVRYDPNFAGYHPFVYNGGGEYEPDDCEVIGNIHQHPELLD